MDFNKKELHTSTLKISKCSQLTIDDDFNVQDSKDDIDKIIAKAGYAVVEEVTTEENKVRVSGLVMFKIVYKTVKKENDLEIMEGEIPFEDVVNLEGVTRDDYAKSNCQIADLTVTVINSRKIEVRGLIENCVNVHEDESVLVACELVNAQGIECQYKNVTMTESVVAKRDVLKLREEIEIPQNKPNIREIVWSHTALRNMDIKPQNDKLLVRGEVEVFVLYKSREEHLPIQYLFTVRTINKEFLCDDAKDDMIISVEANLGKGDVSIKEDIDGEDRVLSVDYNVDMNIRMYEDREEKIISDVYSPQAEIIPEKKSIICENLLMRNSAKAKINYRKKVNGSEEKILQICHVFGNVFVDDININDDNVHVNGFVKAWILYIAAGDDPMSFMGVDIPFEYTVDTVPLSPEDSVRIVPSVDQLTASLLSSEEIEIKAQINLEINIFARTKVDVITNMQVLPIDCEKKASMPGVVGYVVKKGDTIWSLARKYYATTESIKAINNLESDYINEGDRLIIVKS